jgi:hypothetical protein
VVQVNQDSLYPVLHTILADKRIASDHDVNLNAVTPSFFETMGIKIVAGRNFDGHDVRPPGDPGWRSAWRPPSGLPAFPRGARRL